MLESLVNLCLSKYNPAIRGKQDSFGELQLGIKRLFRVLVPDLPITAKIGDICKVVLERDTSAIATTFMEIVPTDIPEKKAIGKKIG